MRDFLHDKIEDLTMAETVSITGSIDNDQSIEIENDSEINGIGDDLARVQILCEDTINSLISQKNDLEAQVHEGQLRRAQAEKDINLLRNKTSVIQRNIDLGEVYNNELEKRRSELEIELHNRKIKLELLPTETFEKQNDCLKLIDEKMKVSSTMFSEFKGKESLENGYKTVSIQYEQLKKELGNLTDRQHRMQVKLEEEKTRWPFPVKSLQSIKTALERDADAAREKLRHLNPEAND